MNRDGVKFVGLVTLCSVHASREIHSIVGQIKSQLPLYPISHISCLLFLTLSFIHKYRSNPCIFKIKSECHQPLKPSSSILRLNSTLYNHYPPQEMECIGDIELAKLFSCVNVTHQQSQPWPPLVTPQSIKMNQLYKNKQTRATNVIIEAISKQYYLMVWILWILKKKKLNGK